MESKKKKEPRTAKNNIIMIEQKQYEPYSKCRKHSCIRSKHCSKKKRESIKTELIDIQLMVDKINKKIVRQHE